jgi:hypothetical protein
VYILWQRKHEQKPVLWIARMLCSFPGASESPRGPGGKTKIKPVSKLDKRLAMPKNQEFGYAVETVNIWLGVRNCCMPANSLIGIFFFQFFWKCFVES